MGHVAHTAPAATKRPVHESEVQAEVWYAGTDREIRGKALCDVGGRAAVGVTLHLGDETFPLRAGSFVCFPAGQALAHHLVNDGDEPCRYLMVGERRSDDEVRYPGSESSQ